MDAARFDALTRRIGARTSRRVALSLVATGLMAIAVPEAAAARCSKQNPCPKCYRCNRQRRCKKKADDALCTGGTCQNGVCTPTSACSPACTGGRVCRANGACTCPADKPVSGTCGASPDVCRECCTAGDCQGNQDCRHDLGSICVCPTGLHFCDGLCWSCCKTEDCDRGRHFADGYICNVNHACVCQGDGELSDCNKADGFGTFCANLNNDEFNCGQCGFKCGEQVCVDGVCTPPS